MNCQSQRRTSLRYPQTTVRWRLTLLYGGMFLVCGAALLAVTYTLVSRGITGGVGITLSRPAPGGGKAPPIGSNTVPVPSLAMPKVPPAVLRVMQSSAGQEFLRLVDTQQRVNDLHQLEIESAVALGIMAILSGLLGWVVAGRVLRPLRTITATAQQISRATSTAGSTCPARVTSSGRSRTRSMRCSRVWRRRLSLSGGSSPTLRTSCAPH